MPMATASWASAGSSASWRPKHLQSAGGVKSDESCGPTCTLWKLIMVLDAPGRPFPLL